MASAKEIHNQLMGVKQVNLQEAHERQALRAMLQLWLLRDGYTLPDELKAGHIVTDKDRLQVLVAALELLGGFDDGGAQAATVRIHEDDEA